MKNLIIASVVGLLFMGGGFWYGLKLKPLPTPTSNAAAAALVQKVAPEEQPPISVDTLTKASESMMSLNDALKAREEKVAEREQAAKAKEDELAAERAALDSSHDKFKALFEEFQQRLQLVEANQVVQLQKEAELYEGMNIDQAIDLIRVKQDADITRLFSVMETKPLGKLVAQWKTKYPQDGTRVVSIIDGISQVMPKEKIALSDTPAATGTSADTGAPAPAADTSAPAPTPDASTPAPAPAPAGTDSTTPAAPAPDATTPSPANPDSATGPASTPPADPNAAPSTDTTSPTNTNSSAPLAPPSDSTQPAAPSAAPAATASN